MYVSGTLKAVLDGAVVRLVLATSRSQVRRSTTASLDYRATLQGQDCE